MAEVQHNEALAESRISSIENTTQHRPDAQTTNDTSTEADLKRYTCLYFGYASNLSPRTMKQRCPDSLFISLARLQGWRWIINETGYANIIPGNPDDEVWGSLCFLSHRDETALDESEGVPWLYEKKKLKVQRMPQQQAGAEWRVDEGEEVEAVVYVDVQRLTEGRVERQYVVWVKKSIEDAKLCGLPESYAEKYINRFLPRGHNGGSTLLERDIMMVRTMKFGDKGAGMVPRGFASWDRG